MSEKESSRQQRALSSNVGGQASLERRAQTRPSRAPQTRPPANAHESRLVPLSVAGVICFLTAGLLGGGAWYLFGTHEHAAFDRPARVTQTASQPASPTTLPPTPMLAPAGELPVAGGEVALGGEGTDIPVRREFVKPFAVAETEVTNEQYQDFVRASGHKAPASWKDEEFPPGAANEPVTNVSWQDATDYCHWLSEKIGATVRLPTEVEWELAAKGKENFKYPWGNDWDDHSADSQESKGRVRVVKSFPAGKSPFGAYDMAGNVWEWVADEARDAEGNLKRRDEVTLRIIKGGSANERREYVNATARYEVPSNFKGSQWIGFRYVVLREGESSAVREGGSDNK